MPIGQKLKLFDLLSQLNCKEIEAGCPAVSQDHLEFVRQLIDEDRIPPGVQISVLTPARTDLVVRTVAALAGAPLATVQLCNIDSAFPGRAFSAVDRGAAGPVLARAVDAMGAAWCSLEIEYSLEACDDTELAVALELCSELADTWYPEPGRELIFNFSADLRRNRPSAFADQVEWLGRYLVRDHTCLSVHPWNDAERGVAAAELTLLAGAQRVEGCLLGRGDQDICLATLGRNLLGYGIDPEIDLSHLDGADRGATAGSQSPRRATADAVAWHPDTRPSHPDAGPWHPDAAPWHPDVAPWHADVAQVVRAGHGLDLPAGLTAEFAALVRTRAAASGQALPEDQILDLFDHEYLLREPASALLIRCSAGRTNISPADPWIALFKIRQSIRTAEDNPALVVAGTLAAMGVEVAILSRHSQELEGSGQIAVYVECAAGTPVWGAGVGGDLTAATLKAVLSAVNRAEFGSSRDCAA